MRISSDINSPLIKPFKCDSCHMGFTQQTDVQRHFDRIHKKLKPFTCELCQEKFARNYELKQHLTTAHAETIVDSEMSDNEDVCAEEEKNTVIRTESNNPEEIKQALEEFKCETCDAIFFAKSHLMRHQIKVHQINHNYQCDLCHKILGSKNDLKRHVESVHEKKKPYMCSKCLTTFSRKSYGKSHLKMVHKLDDLSLIIDTTIIEKEIDENQGTIVQKTNTQDVNVEEIEAFQRALFKCLPCKVW